MSFKFPHLGRDFEMTGLWWRPEYPDDRLAGTLESREGRLLLKLIGNFGSEIRLVGNEKISIIVGVAEAKNMTLLECFHAGTGLKIPGTSEQMFWPRYVFAGERHLSDGTKTPFKTFAIQFTDLGPWLMRSPVTESFKVDEDHKLEEISHVYRRLPKLTLSIARVPAELNYGYSFETRSDHFRSIGFETVAYSEIVPSNPRDIEWFHDHLQVVLDLHSLLVGRRVRIEHLYATTVSDKGHPAVYDLIEGFPLPKADTDRLPHEILVPLPEITDSLPTILDRWYEQREAMKEPVSLFLGAESSLTSEVRLLLLSQALESFHRNVYGGAYLTYEDYEPIYSIIVKAIPGSVDQNLKDALKSRLRYGYQYSLRRRLSELLDQFEDTTLATIRITSKEFAERITAARNFYTHWDRSSTSSLVSGFDLANLVNKLEALARLIFLKHIGVREEIVLKGMQRSRHLYLQEYTPLS